MKRLLSILSAAALFCGTASCSKAPLSGAEPADPDSATLLLDWAAPATRAAALPAEKRVNSLVIYVFDRDGRLDLSHACTGGELAEQNAVIRLKTGSKTVWALANLGGEALERANACMTLEAFESVPIALSDNAPDAFVMTARSGLDLPASGRFSLRLELARPVAKVALGSVANRLPAPYGSMTLCRAFLCNVAGDRTLGGAAADPVSWLNPEGTPDRGGKEHTIGQGGYAAQAAELTFRELGDAVLRGSAVRYPLTDEGGKFFYAFPNARREENDGYTEPFSPTATVLMLVVKIGRHEYYYPVALDRGLGENTLNVVDVTLTGLGNSLQEGPFNKIGKTGLEAAVSVRDWIDTAAYTENI